MTTDLKREFLELLEKDKEFRYAVAGLLGYREILEELKRLREDFNKLYQKSLEHDKRFEAIEQELKKLRENLNRYIEESSRRFEAIEQKLLEHDKRFEELRIEIRDLRLAVNENRKRLSRLELAVGALTESFYAKLILDKIASIARSEGDEVIRWERSARIDEEDIDLHRSANRD